MDRTRGLKKWLVAMFPGYPVAPFLEDHELEDLLADLEEVGVEVGADGVPVGPSALTVAEEALRRAELKRAEFRLVGEYPCPACGGEGQVEGKPCRLCEGAGSFIVEASLLEALQALGLEVPS